MSKHKYTNIVCIAVIVALLALTAVFIYSPNLGVTVTHEQPEYAETLFSTDTVHTIDIQVEAVDWEDMLANAQSEEYIQATVVIDGETVSGVGLRPKGNSSLSMIASSDSDRYSFKIEFDHYSDSISYHGLDKLALNNIAQDNTYMKDYISYQMMNEMGAAAPLSSFIWVTVNGEDWGLYLAAEGIDESFAQRVYGNDFGEIYKPDSMDMNDNMGGNGDENGARPQMAELENGERPDMGQFVDQNGNIDQQAAPDSAAAGELAEDVQGVAQQFAERGGGFGSETTTLAYIDDDPDSYTAIFDNSVFDPSDADQNRLINSLKQLNQGENLEEVLDIDEVIRYFVVHNFVLNSDSYTGSMIHNYYLAENDGQLSMIAWDYNLAFGGMGIAGGRGGKFGRDTDLEQTDASASTTIDTATSLVNYPIDSPLLSGTIDSKPMIAWIFENQEYLEQYHEIFEEYMEYFNSGKFAEMYDNAVELISPYVEKDPTAFCTYDDFQEGSAALREFCLLRADSINGQLEGTIAATSEEQTETNNANFVDAAEIDIESMGSNSMGFGRARNEGGFPGGDFTPPTAQGEVADDTIDTVEDSVVQEGVSQNIENNPGDEFTSPTAQGEVTDDTIDTVEDSGEQEGVSQNNNARVLPADLSANGSTPDFTVSVNDIVLLAASFVLLIGGILFAKKRKL